jgi:peptide/nickel transport system substrate-binding protein
MEPLRGEDPRRVGRYRLVARLGAGGMGQVFLGFSPAGRLVAVKVVNPDLARDEAFLVRFRQEVASARKVSGAYTAAVIDDGDGDRPWLATALVMGPSLADVVERQGPLPEISVWRLAAGLAEALADVHSCELVHRDLKPSNVLLAADGPRVIDFGISRALDGARLTGTGMMIGTPTFMSPEQATGEPVGPASDVFSFGGVLTFAATGSPPFGDGTPAALFYRVVHAEPMLAGLSPALSRLVTRCLAKRPADRATLAESMQIITANLGPTAAAMSFWPAGLADLIGSYQARFAAEARAWTAAEPELAPTWPAPGQTGRPGSADEPEPDGGGAGSGRRDGPATITAPRQVPSQTPVPGTPETVPPGPATPPTARRGPATPPDSATPVVATHVATPPPILPTRSLRRRRTLVASLGGLAVAVTAVVVVLANLVSPSHPSASSPGRVTAGHTTGPGAQQPAGGFGAIPPESGTPHRGTLRFAEPPGTAPTWILPLATNAAAGAFNVFGFDYQMWRPLYWANQGVAATIDPAMSLARPPAWSNGDTTVTITLNPAYRWSDGKPVSAQDVAFDIDLIKAAVAENAANWAYYVPGFFPHDLAGVSTLNQDTLVLTLNSAVNPSWFYENQLAELQPMPAHAWAKASASGPLLDFTDPGKAKAIYDYLAAASAATSTWAANPLWRVVDGPFRLTSFDHRTGADSLAANPSYGGPDRHQITALTGVPFTSDNAEFAALANGTVDEGFVPFANVPRVPQLRSAGYNVFGFPDFAWAFAVYNFKDTTGDFNHIAAQLYFRQAMAHLVDQQRYIAMYMHGAGGQDYGPLTAVPVGPYTPANATSDPYPFSVAAAQHLLASHGWQVVPGGTDTCANPGSGVGQCGDGIPGGTKLSFNFVYVNEAPFRQEATDLAGEARQAGITITTVPSTFAAISANDNDVIAPGNANTWAMADFGGFTVTGYPTTVGVFNTQGAYNEGGYSDPRADQLITASLTSANPVAVRDELAYLTAQQPGLFEPIVDEVFAWRKTLSGPLDSFASLTRYYLTPELWYYTR